VNEEYTHTITIRTERQIAHQDEVDGEEGERDEA